MQGHLSVGRCRDFEAEPLVESVRIACVQFDRSDTGDKRTRDDALDEPFTKPFPSMRVEDEDITEISVAGIVGDNPGETD